MPLGVIHNAETPHYDMRPCTALGQIGLAGWFLHVRMSKALLDTKGEVLPMKWSMSFFIIQSCSIVHPLNASLRRWNTA
jgi:hypothetical protein